MRAFWALARLRVFDVLRSRGATFAFLGLPVLILVVLSLVFASGHPFEDRRITVVTSDGDLAWLKQALGPRAGLRIEAEPELAVARRKLETRATNAVLIRTNQQGLRLEVGTKEELWGRGLVSALPPLELSLVPLGSRGYLQFLFPGLLCSSVMFAGMFGMGYAMARYRQTLFLKKLSTMPLRRSTFVIAQIAGRGSLVALQVSLLLLAAALLFELRLTWSGIGGLGLLCSMGLFVFSGIGFALASLIETEAVVSDVISGLTLPFTLFSGMFFPLDALPAWLASICAWLPSTLLVNAVRTTLLYDAGFASVTGELGALLVWGAAMFAVSVRLFRWHR